MKGLGPSLIVLTVLEAAPAAEVWRSTFDTGSDSLVNITSPNVGLLPKLGSPAGGRIPVANYDQMSGMSANKAGRPLGMTVVGGADFSALCQFRWTELWPSGPVSGYGAFDFFTFMGGTDPDFTKQVLGAAINHYRDASGSYWVRLAVGVGASGIGAGEWWFSAGNWVNLGPGLLGQDLQLTVGYAGSSAGKSLSLRLYDASAVLLTQQSVDLATSPAAAFISRLSLTHIGWTDYLGSGPAAGQNIVSRWDVDTLAFFNTSDGATLALSRPENAAPTWSSDRHHRVVVEVPPLAIGRTSDELVASLNIDFSQYLGQQPVDLSSLQVVRYATDTGQVLSYAANTYATTPGDRPLRFYDDAIPWNYPDRAGNANDTGGQANPIVNMEGGGRYFNPLGDAHSGRVAWVHSQDGNHLSRYTIYFNGLPGNTPPRQPPAGFIGDGVNRNTLGATQFAPVIHGRVDTADLNGDGLFDLVLGNATGTILWYPNVGQPNVPSFQYARLLMTDDGGPLDVGWSAAPRVVDWDGDGRLDIIAGAEMAGVVLYFRNVGTHSSPLFHRVGLLMADSSTISVPPSPCAEDPTNAIFSRDYYPVPEVVDWNGDGRMDLLLGGYITGYIWYYENVGTNPDGTPQLSYRGPLQAVPPEGGAPRPIDVTWCAAPMVADLSGDGRLDLVSGAMQMTAGVGDLADPEKFLWYYENAGTRTAPQLVWKAFPKTGTFAFGLLGTPRAIDYNGDGKLDLIVSTMGSLLMLPNIGTLTSPLYNASTAQLGLPWGNTPLSFSQLVDYNADGWPDLFTGTAVRLNTGAGAPGVFGATVQLPGASQINHPNPSGDQWDYRTFADLDGDGLRDIEVGDHQGYVWFHRNQGTAGSPQIDPNGVQVMLTTGQPLRVGTTTGGAFDQLQGARTVQTIGDFNHDGRPDLAVADTYGYIRQFLGAPGSPLLFNPGTIVAQPVATRLSIQAVDWNGDGWDDLIAAYASSTGDMNYIILNSAQAGTATFAPPATLPLTSVWGWPMLYVGDWNHDGDVDLLIDQYGYTRYVERSFVDHGYAPSTLVAHETDGTPNPSGACCLPDGTCTTADAFNCPGAWKGAGVTCAQTSCPQPGACCQPDGSCAQTLEAACTGLWHGAGTLCASTACPQPGACCRSDGSCGQSLQADCQGQWMGVGTTCAQGTCGAVTGEVWRSTFNSGTTEGVTTFMTGQTSPAHQPLGPVAQGVLQVTAVDYNCVDPNYYLPYKSGRSLGTIAHASDSFSGLYVFRWSQLQQGGTTAGEFAGFMSDVQPYQTRPVCGALLRHYSSGGNAYVTLGVGFGTVGATWFGVLYGPSINLGTSATSNTYQLAVGFNASTHVLSVALYSGAGALLGRMDPDLDTDVAGLQSPGTPAQEIGGLAMNYLGWMDYRDSGGNLPTVWQVDTLAYFASAQGAFIEATQPRRAPADFNGDGHVDTADSAHFVGCGSGSAVPQDRPECHDADLDGDGDVDASDFGLLQLCVTGPVMTADPDCTR